MNRSDRLWQVTAVIFGTVFVLMTPVLAGAAGERFFGPPNGTTTVAGEVSGSNVDTYPDGIPGATSININIPNPWVPCIGAVTVTANKINSSSTYNEFVSLRRTFTIDTLANGAPIGGAYEGWTDVGRADLIKSNAAKASYDQVRLTGSTSKRTVNVLLSLVGKSGFIGVANIASLGVIDACGSVNGNSQIWVPIGPDKKIILDIDGDGVADPGFLAGPALSAGPLAAVSVPTLSQWGLIALVVLLLVVGLYFSRKNDVPFASA